MKTYTYYLEMEYLSQRAEKVLKNRDRLMSEVYSAAALGFHHKSENISAAKAEETLSSPQYETLKRLRKWVENKELEATKEKA